MSISLSAINQLLVQEDIEGLIEIGAPEDEYQQEAADMAAALAKLGHPAWTTEMILSLLITLWGNSFGISGEEMALRLPALTRVAQKIQAFATPLSR